MAPLAPLFPQFSWSEEQMGRDQRRTLEQELRNRGLLANQYAIQVSTGGY